MTMPYAVSIVIVGFNTRELVVDCLRSVYAGATKLHFEVIVVDNASHDGSAEAIAASFPQVRLIRNDLNRGFAAANNQGLRVAQGRYVLLLNPDTLIVDDALEKMIVWMDVHPDVGCSGCQVLEDQTTIQRTCFRFPSPLHVFLDLTGLSKAWPRSPFFGRYWYGNWDRRSERDVDVVSGMYLLVRRAVIESIGPLDESYFVYGEEADWCYKMHRAGIRRAFTPLARIIHRDGGGHSTKLASRRMYVQLQKSLLIFCRKNLGLGSWTVVKTMLSIAMAARWAICSLLGLIARADRARHKAAQSAAALRFHVLGREPAA